MYGEAVDNNPATWSATRLAAAIGARELSSRELLALYLDRIERLDPGINAVVTLDAEGAERAAAAADERTARGEPLGPLHGLPITVKDAQATAGMRSTGGGTELAENVPAQDADAVALVRGAGAIVFGKTNVPRWSADMQSYNDLFGTTNNPWATARTCGGSSGGSAASTACGFTSFELGGDSGGSIRIPAHFCGVYSIRPTSGVIPAGGGIYAAPVEDAPHDPFGVIGPLARAPEDLDLLMSVLAAPDPVDAPAWRIEMPAAEQTSLADYRIGIWLDDPFCPVEREYSALLRAAADALTTAGARVEEARPVDFEQQFDVYWQLGAAASPLDAAYLAPDEQQLTHADFLRLSREQERLDRDWASWFERFDLMLCPVVASAAFRHDHGEDMIARTIEIDGKPRPYLDSARWTGLTGGPRLPVVAAPIGRTAAGLPVGVQIAAPRYHDRRAIRAATLLGELLGGYETPPGFE